MKTIAFILSLSLFSFTLSAGEGELVKHHTNHGQLEVNIDGVTSAEGTLKVLLFHQEIGFPLEDKNAMYAVDVDASKADNKVVFKSIPYGEYAIYVYHDENNNGRFDKTIVGAPKEGFGYTNMKSKKRTAPLFSQSTFEFEEGDNGVTIELQPAVK